MQKSVEERVAEIKSILFDRPMMLLTKPIRLLENRMVGEKCTGYKVGLDNLSYRGIWVSTIEDIEMNIDGEMVPKDSIYLNLNGQLYPAYTLQGHTEVFWTIEDEAELWVNKVGGLSKGSHIIEITVTKRQDFGHSYGEGKEGYEKAFEFTCPAVIKDRAEFVI